MNCASNIITANFSGGKTHATTARVYQWSRGIELCITGADNLPQTFKAHFSVQKKGGVATTIVGIDERVEVPNVLFTIGKDIHVWLGASETADDAEILYTVDIPVAPAPMPEYYDAEDTGVFDAVVEQVADYAATATAAANSAGASASAAAASATAAAGSANSASASAASAATNASRAEVSRSEAEAAQASASASAATASDKAAEASASATAAGQSASDAAASKTAAVNAATAAGQAASAAGNSATTATTKAAEAAASASDAAQSATAAAGSATTAQTAAQTATTKAGEASASATAAEAAKTAAQTAQTAAETAETNAGQSASTATAKAAEAAQSASGAAQSKTDAEAAATRAEQAAATLTVDSALSDTSVNPVQNKIITSEITDVKTAIDYMANGGIFTPEILSIRSLSNKVASNASHRSVVFPVRSGYTYTVEAVGTINRNYTYGISATHWDIGTPTENLNYTPVIETLTEGTTMTITPSGYNFILITFAYSTADPYRYNFTVTVTESQPGQHFKVNGVPVPTYAEFNTVSAEVDRHDADIVHLTEAIGSTTVQLIGGYSTASYWNKESAVAEKKSAAAYIAWDAIEVTPGDTYTVSIYQGTSLKQDPVLIVDAQYNILDTYRGTNSQINTFTVDVTDVTAKYALLTSYGASSLDTTSMTHEVLTSVPDIKAQVESNTTAISLIGKSDVTDGKYVSILGDSISALAGTIPSGNEAYYSGSNYGITSADDMWWKIVADKLGMSVLVNNSWSGSQVCDRTPGAKIPASYASRCQALHDSNHNPDYVMIAMGVNDYSYNSYLGDWDGKTMPVDDVDFTQSYALMLNRIKSAYPNVKIICISPWFVQRGQDTGITYVNSQTAHLTESAYGGVIKKLCDMLGAIYIDGDVGFNRYNYYPTYCEDDQTSPTHPNKAGQAVMGGVIASKIMTAIY